MRELTAFIRFVTPSLGRDPDRAGRLWFTRDAGGAVLFMPSWHQANFRYAAKLLGRHQDVVREFAWEPAVIGNPASEYKRSYKRGRRTCFAVHEAFAIGSGVAIHLAAPAAVPDDDVKELLSLAGRYRGLSPFRPGEFGMFVVTCVRSRAAERSAIPGQPTWVRL